MSQSLIYAYSSDEFKQIISKSYSYSESLRNLGYKTKSGTTLAILKKRIKKENIDISHFGTKRNFRVLTRDMVFKKDSDVTQHTLRD